MWQKKTVLEAELAPLPCTVHILHDIMIHRVIQDSFAVHNIRVMSIQSHYILVVYCYMLRLTTCHGHL
jgi:hypothetical protein